MNPPFVIAAVRGALRIGRTIADAFQQYAQEKPILVPDAERLTITDPVGKIIRVASRNTEFCNLLRNDSEISKLWDPDNERPTDVDGATETLFAIAMRYKNESLRGSNVGDAQTAREVAGGIMVGQWAQGKGPVTPAARVVVALADVALEYVGANPQILSVGGDGEKLIGAIASAIGVAIPDAETRIVLGPKDRFAERISALALQSGLKVLSENPDLVFSEAHLQELTRNALVPLVEALPDETEPLQRQVKWREVSEALVGPAFSAALKTLAEHQTAFLGRNYASDQAVGVMVSGLLKEAAKEGVGNLLSGEAKLHLFRTVFAIAAEHPDIVLGDLIGKDLSEDEARSKAETLALNVFRSVVSVLDDRTAPFDDDLGIAIVAAAIDGLKQSRAALFDATDPWKNIAGNMASQVLDGLQKGLTSPTGMAISAFSRDDILNLSRVFFEQVARTPHMLKLGGKELERLVAAVSGAMAKDQKLLLTADDWSKIAAVAAQEAALNPGRLFGLSEESLQGKLATDVIGRLLSAAATDIERSGRATGPLLIGETLREAVIVTLRGIGGNIEDAFRNRSGIQSLAEQLNDAAAERALTMGGKEWLKLFRAFLPDVLSKGTLPQLDDAAINNILST